MAKRSWNPSLHPRNPGNGEFTERGGGSAWARRIVDSMPQRLTRDVSTGKMTGMEKPPALKDILYGGAVRRAQTGDLIATGKRDHFTYEMKKAGPEYGNLGIVITRHNAKSGKTTALYTGSGGFTGAIAKQLHEAKWEVAPAPTRSLSRALLDGPQAPPPAAQFTFPGGQRGFSEVARAERRRGR